MIELYLGGMLASALTLWAAWPLRDEGVRAGAMAAVIALSVLAWPFFVVWNGLRIRSEESE